MWFVVVRAAELSSSSSSCSSVSPQCWTALWQTCLAARQNKLWPRLPPRQMAPQISAEEVLIRSLDSLLCSTEEHWPGWWRQCFWKYWISTEFLSQNTQPDQISPQVSAAPRDGTRVLTCSVAFSQRAAKMFLWTIFIILHGIKQTHWDPDVQLQLHQ